jgi:hypothetical protein
MPITSERTTGLLRNPVRPRTYTPALRATLAEKEPRPVVKLPGSAVVRRSNGTRVIGAMIRAWVKESRRLANEQLAKGSQGRLERYLREKGKLELLKELDDWLRNQQPTNGSA